eukprot:9878912-Alexandrium_andersonii.AAC.1
MGIASPAAAVRAPLGSKPHAAGVALRSAQVSPCRGRGRCLVAQSGLVASPRRPRPLLACAADASSSLALGRGRTCDGLLRVYGATPAASRAGSLWAASPSTWQ